MPGPHPNPLPPITEERADRFWRNVKILSEDECWPWIGSTFNNGYGRTCLGDKSVLASRVAFKLFYGSDPYPCNILHSCDHGPEACTNPHHFALGSPHDNILDAASKGRMAKGERNGHRTKPEATPRGSNSGNAILTEELVSQIRATKFKRGERKRLADKLGVSGPAISAVIYGRSWKHVV